VARDLLAEPSAAALELESLRHKELNFRPRPRPSAGEGWRIDDYRQALPPEEAGPPVSGGTWEVARRILQDYDFVDPAIVRALYRANDPLEGRDMLLELRIWGLRFHVGVRVGEVADATVFEDGRLARVWGWNYRTLDGHFEAGQMDYEVRKWLDTGVVEFRIEAFSRTAHIANPIVRLGFRLLGRRKQTQFGRRACERMLRLTVEQLRAGGKPARPRIAGNGLVVCPASASIRRGGRSD
jgi:uncharacterized protein (UPF0548 family)